jgi:hypothetical protein
MDKQEARVLFDAADRLYKSGRYEEALQQLLDLRHEFSDDFNVLYPILLCYEKLGRMKEARFMCNDMIEHFGGAKHRIKLCKVYERLLKQAPDPKPDRDPLSGRAIIKDKPQVIEVDGSGLIELWGRWIPWKSILIGVGVLGAMFAFIVLLPLVLPKDEEGVVVGAKGIIVVTSLLVQYVLNCVVFYIALWTTNKLLHEDVMLDVIDVCIFAPIFGFLVSIPILGWAIAWYVVAERYEMGLIDFVSFVLVLIVVNVAFIYMVLPSIFGPAVFNFL